MTLDLPNEYRYSNQPQQFAMAKTQKLEGIRYAILLKGSDPSMNMLKCDFVVNGIELESNQFCEMVEPFTKHKRS